MPGNVNNKEQVLQELNVLRHRVAAMEELERDRSRTDKGLRESEERYRGIFRYSNDAIFVMDPSQNAILDANPRACDMLGYSHEELLSIPISAIHPDEMPQMQLFAQSVFDKGHGWTNELTCTTREGGVIHAEISASVIADTPAKPYMIAIVRDITERRRAEEILLQQMKDLAVLEERNRLARDIHDTLAQGLTGIIWQLNAAQRTCEGGGEQAVEALERVRSLVRECLQGARRSVWDLRQGPLQGATLAEALRNEATRAAGDEKFQTSFAVSGQERVLPAGLEATVLRICQESLTNVVKHAQATQVTVTLAYESSSTQLIVQDDGVGFDPQAHGTRGKESGGFGLIGMRERARLLGGELTVRSEPGRGTLVEALFTSES